SITGACCPALPARVEPLTGNRKSMSDLLWILAGLVFVVIAVLFFFTLVIARRVELGLPPEGRFITLMGNRLNYVEQGSGPETLLLIHGLGGVVANYAYAMLGELAKDCRVVAIDRPGSGYSKRARGASASLAAQADVLAAAIDALQLGRPVLVGHSPGGAGHGAETSAEGVRSGIDCATDSHASGRAVGGVCAADHSPGLAARDFRLDAYGAAEHSPTGTGAGCGIRAGKGPGGFPPARRRGAGAAAHPLHCVVTGSGSTGTCITAAGAELFRAPDTGAYPVWAR